MNDYPDRQQTGTHVLRCLVIATACCLAAAGCEVPQPPDSTAATAPPEPVYLKEDSKEFKQLQTARSAAHAERAAAAEAAAQAKADAEAEAAAEAETAADGAETEGDGTATKGRDTGGRRVKAERGAGKRKALEPGIITTSINAYFSAKERMAFNQVVNGLKLYHAANGRKPKDFAEVDAKIIKPHGVRLPELEPGDKYIYDPDEGPNGAIMILKKE